MISGILLPEVRSILERNGIDMNRCTSVDIHHDVRGKTTEINVTLLAIHPDDYPRVDAAKSAERRSA
jgi:hypothetical protein